MRIVKLLHCHIACLLVGMVILLLGMFFLVGCGREETVTKFAEVKIGGVTIRAEVARNDESRTRGLSGRESLGEDEGMLFVFDEARYRSFWMKGMKFSIDILFINTGSSKCETTKKMRNYENAKDGCEYYVVDIVENLLPPGIDEEPARYESKRPANYVLEVKAGFVEAQGIKIGDEVDFFW